MALDNFILKAELSRGAIIGIPEGASSYSLRSGKIIFYKNGYGKYPLSGKAISFPNFERHRFNIHYGEPRYEKEIL